MSVPTTMKAFTIPSRATYQNPYPISVIQLNQSFPVPTPTPSQALVRIHAAAITSFEVSWPNDFAPQPRVPCHDISGILISCPPSSNFAIGDRVMCLLPFTGQGGLAEFAAIEPKYLARIPDQLGFVEAASLPRAGLTAWQAYQSFVDAGYWSKPGVNILVTGATGAVGKIAVQIFKHFLREKGKAGHITAVGGSGSEILSNYGADLVIDYREEKDWEEKFAEQKKFDIVLDCVGRETLEKCLKVVKNGGMVITVASPPPEWEQIKGLQDNSRQLQRKFFIVKERGDQLKELGELAKIGLIRPSIGLVVDGLTEGGVRAGWLRGQNGGLQGSVVVKII